MEWFDTFGVKIESEDSVLGCSVRILILSVIVVGCEAGSGS